MVPASDPQCPACIPVAAPSNRSTITLAFDALKTECSYDYLFVYDGPSMNSPIIAALSGDVVPTRPLTALSGQMLIFLYSDTNYVLEGFHARYTVQDPCGSKCSGHGRCTHNRCACDEGWAGLECDQVACPSNCTDPQGTCNAMSRRCICKDGWAGAACDKPTENNQWHSIVPSGVPTYQQERTFKPRMRHTAVYDQGRDAVYIFGGISFGQYFSDLLEFNFTTRVFSAAGNGLSPAPRYAHTAVMHSDGLMYVYGGTTQNGTVGDLWTWNPSTRAWSLIHATPGCSTRAISNCTSIHPPRIAGHTATLVDDTSFFVIGGRATEEKMFHDAVHIFQFSSQSWETHTYSKEVFAQVAGHTTVYHSNTRSLLVFGGFRPFHARYSERDDDVYRLSVDSMHVTRIPPLPGARQPAKLAFHSANMLGDDRMVVFGGNQHVHFKDESCYNPRLHVYDVSCNTWTHVDTDEKHVARYAHAAAARRGAIYVFGGFDGVTRDDAITFRPSLNWCAAIDSTTQCKTSPSCGVCASQPASIYAPAMRKFIATTQMTMQSTVERLTGVLFSTIEVQHSEQCALACLELPQCGLYEIMPANASVSTNQTRCVLYSTSLACAPAAGMLAHPAVNRTVYERVDHRQSDCSTFKVASAHSRCITEPALSPCHMNASCVGWRSPAPDAKSTSAGVVCECHGGFYGNGSWCDPCSAVDNQPAACTVRNATGTAPPNATTAVVCIDCARKLANASEVFSTNCSGLKIQDNSIDVLFLVDSTNPRLSSDAQTKRQLLTTVLEQLRGYISEHISVSYITFNATISDAIDGTVPDALNAVDLDTSGSALLGNALAGIAAMDNKTLTHRQRVIVTLLSGQNNQSTLSSDVTLLRSALAAPSIERSRKIVLLLGDRTESASLLAASAMREDEMISPLAADNVSSVASSVVHTILVAQCIAHTYNTSAGPAKGAASPEQSTEPQLCFASRLASSSPFAKTTSEHLSLIGAAGWSDAYQAPSVEYTGTTPSASDFLQKIVLSAGQSSTHERHFPELALASASLATEWLPATTVGLPGAQCAITQEELSPWWQGNLHRAHAIHMVRLSGTRDCTGAPSGASCASVAAVHVSAGMANATNVVNTSTTTECMQIDAAREPREYLCHGARASIVTITGTNGSLVLCQADVLTANVSSFAEDGGGSSALCGALGKGIWQRGGCAGNCAAYNTCTKCTRTHKCGWCPTGGAYGVGLCMTKQGAGASQCQHEVRLANLTVATRQGLLATTEQCGTMDFKQGLTRERYFIENVRSIAQLQARREYQATFPTSHDVIPDFASVARLKTYGERIHGFVVPKTSGKYFFWVRSYQGMETQLLMNKQGASSDPKALTLIASQPRKSRAPQRDWKFDPKQKSVAIDLQAMKKYYIQTLTIVEDAKSSRGEHVLTVAWTREVYHTPLSGKRSVLPGSVLLPFDVDNCTRISNCNGCTAMASCGWCRDKCVSHTSPDAQACLPQIGKDGQTGERAVGEPMILDVQECEACTDLVDCKSCADHSGCEWKEYYCRSETTDTAAVRKGSVPTCPRACSSRNDCSTCLESKTCSWCDSTNSCFEFSGYLHDFMAGSCKLWKTKMPQCAACGTELTCKDCNTKHGCGWCHSPDDTTQGRCISGSFLGPDTPNCPRYTAAEFPFNYTHETPTTSSSSTSTLTGTTSTTITTTTVTTTTTTTTTLQNDTSSTTTTTTTSTTTTTTTIYGNGTRARYQNLFVQTMWSWSTCPDVDECLHGYDKCDNTSTLCNNSAGSYSCICRSGYGAKPKSNLASQRACDPICTGCIRGRCKAPGVCECNEGMSGPNCTACINHAACDVSSQNRAEGLRPLCIPHVGATTVGSVIEGLTTNRTNSSAGGLHQCQCPSFAVEDPATGACQPTCRRFGCVHGECVQAATMQRCRLPNCSRTDQVSSNRTTPNVQTCNVSEGQTALEMLELGVIPSGTCETDAHYVHQECQCKRGWTGANCNECVASQQPACHALAACTQRGEDSDVVDGSGASSTNVTCFCPSGYEGDGYNLCTPTCKGGCQRGTCIAPNVCECTPGFAGDQCDQCDDNEHPCHAYATCGINATTTGRDRFVRGVHTYRRWSSAVAGRTPTTPHSLVPGLNYTRTAATVLSVPTGVGVEIYVARFSKLGYYCGCLPGYVGDGVQCRALCSEGCEHGTCSVTYTPTPQGAALIASNTTTTSATGDAVADVFSMSHQCGCNPGWLTANCSKCNASLPLVAASSILNISNTSNTSNLFPCADHATCVPGGGTQTVGGTVTKLGSCQCDDGYEGDGSMGCKPVCPSGCVHGECTFPGVCKCNRSWGGSACTECSPSNPCALNASCEVSTNPRIGDTSQPEFNQYNCTCASGFQGTGQECTPICEAGCVHGTCDAPNTCSCKKGWGGSACDMCTVHIKFTPCVLNSKCNEGVGTCDCNGGYEGDGAANCTPVCNQGCTHGTCTAPDTCECTALATDNRNVTLWTGPSCSSCVTDKACHANATCTGSRCMCTAGHTGDGVHDCSPDCPEGCGMGVCTKPGQCDCKPGWTNDVYSNCTECTPAVLGRLSDNTSDYLFCGANADCTPTQTQVPVQPESNASTATRTAFMCACKQGFALADRQGCTVMDGSCCEPVCTTRCGHGTCVAPDTCECDNGWGGKFCDECPAGVCSKHSICRKVNSTEEFAAKLAHEGLLAGPTNSTFDAQNKHGCLCPANHTGNGTTCEPICTQGCLRGVCVAPDVCECSDSRTATGITAWSGADCSQCVQGAHGCHSNATCFSLEAGTVRCFCDSGYHGTGYSCDPVCQRACVHGTCTAPNTCTCAASTKSGFGPAWTGELCTECVQGAHSCHANSTCSSVNGRLVCTCDPGWTGNGNGPRGCRPVCSTVECGPHGTCIAPEKCECKLGYTGTNCSIDCGCNFHSSCNKGVGKCDKCQEYTSGPDCSKCAPDAWGPHHTACRPCNCNNHGTCDPLTGECKCDTFTVGTRCDKCRPGLYGNPRNGGACYHGCSDTTNRVELVGNFGWFGSGETKRCQSQRHGPGTYCHRVQHSCSFIINTRKSYGSIDDGSGALGQQPQQGVTGTTVAAQYARATTITFDSFQMECAWDVVRVYDGPSFSSRLLGVFSGLSPPPVLRSNSSVLLIHMYSDYNWALEGFKGHYVVEDCAGNCSSHGVCDRTTARCDCDSGWKGHACDVPWCPESCSGNGSCSAAHERCMCAAGFTGPACNIPTQRGVFYQHEASMRAPRTRHSMVYHNGGGRGDELWTYGGYSHEVAGSDGVLREFIRADVEMYSLSKQMWSTLKCTSKQCPVGRYGHTAVAVDGAMLVFGGRITHRRQNASTTTWSMNTAGLAVPDVWSLRFATREWSKLWPPVASNVPGVSSTTLLTSTTATPDAPPVVPIAVHGHTATVIAGSMHVLGGLNIKDELVWQFIRFDANTAQWEKCSTRGSFPGGLFGHTAVYSNSTGSLYVFGGRGRIRMTDGLIQKTERLFSYRRVATQERLWIFMRAEQRWYLGPAPGEDQVKSGAARLLHSAALLGRFMVVFGGSPFDHDHEQRCYDADVMVYDTTCGRWLAKDEALVMNLTASKPIGGNGAALAVVDETTVGKQNEVVRPTSMWLTGGFRGSSTNRMYFLHEPTPLCGASGTASGSCPSTAVVPDTGINTTAANTTAANTTAANTTAANTTAANTTAANTTAANTTAANVAVTAALAAGCRRQNISCGSKTSCAICASAYDKWSKANVCAWVYEKEGSEQGVTGKCVNLEDTANKSAFPYAIVDATQCDACGLRPNCKACNEGGDVEIIGASSNTTSACHWYQKLPFRYSFCFSTRESAVAQVDTTPSASCPASCSVHDSCNTCSSSPGCMWCQGEQICIPEEMFAFHATEGQCTQLTPPKDNEVCPKSCSKFQSCASCFENPHCGWCLDKNTGQGTCQNGDFDGSAVAGERLKGCVAGDHSSPAWKRPRRAFTDFSESSMLAVGTNATSKGHEWRFFVCPNVNECASVSDNDCSENANCKDIDKDLLAGDPPSYTCECKVGYADGNAKGKPGRSCQPVCEKYGCDLDKGSCVAPDTCECKPDAYTQNCSKSCGCNLHSKCEQITEPPYVKCKQCIHNTMGDTCELCSPGYHGIALDGGNLQGGDPAKQCVPCMEKCNSHTGSCVQTPLPPTRAVEGPNATVSEPTCLDCRNKTAGPFCNECVPGYFLDPSAPEVKDPTTGVVKKVVRCVKCKCFGNGNMCNPATGGDCVCDSNSHTYSNISYTRNAQCNLCMPGYRPAAGGSSDTKAPPLPLARQGDPCYKEFDAGAAFSPAKLVKDSKYNTLDLALSTRHAQAGDDWIKVAVTLGEVLVFISTTPTDHLPGNMSCTAAGCLDFRCTVDGCMPMDEAASSGSGRLRRDTPYRLKYTDTTPAVNGLSVNGTGYHALRLPCMQLNLFGAIFITFAPVSSVAEFKYAASSKPSETGMETTKHAECAACVDCDEPCIPGRFQDPVRRHRCQKCECNRHGDVCHSRTGHHCGVAANGCNHITGEGCTCAHGTVSNALKCTAKHRCPTRAEQCYACQCNVCKDLTAYNDQAPLDGKQCFSALKVRHGQQKYLGSGMFHHFFTDARSLRFTNIDVRVIVDVWEGEVEVMTSLGSDLSLALDGNYTNSKTLLQAVSNIRHKTVVIVSTDEFMPSARFFLSVRATKDSKYTVYLDQSVLQINLFVFFSVFFSCFFLFFAVLAFASEVRLQLVRIEQRQQAEVQLMQLSQRPMATVQVVLCRKYPDAVEAAAAAAAASTKPRKGNSVQGGDSTRTSTSSLPEIRGTSSQTAAQPQGSVCITCNQALTPPFHRCGGCEATMCAACHALPDRTAVNPTYESIVPRASTSLNPQSSPGCVRQRARGRAGSDADHDSDDTADGHSAAAAGVGNSVAYLEVEGAFHNEIDCDAPLRDSDLDIDPDDAFGPAGAGPAARSVSAHRPDGGGVNAANEACVHTWFIADDSSGVCKLPAVTSWALLEAPHLEHPAPIASQFTSHGTNGTAIHTYLLEQPDGTVMFATALATEARSSMRSRKHSTSSTLDAAQANSVQTTAL